MTREPRHGITLIELVATVAAFGLLAAALAPALADVGRRGKHTVCLQNLARIAEASIIYASEDPDGQAVPVHPEMYNAATGAILRRALGAYCWGGKSGRGREGSDVLFWGTARDKGPATRPINRILYGDVFPDYRTNPGPGFRNWHSDTTLDLSVYRCPSDSGYTGHHYASWIESKLTSFDHYGSSYAANPLWVYMGCEGTCSSNSVFLHRLSEIVNPAGTLYYQENCSRWTWLVQPVDISCQDYDDSIVGGWHGRPWLFNVAFVDGHVAPTHMRGSRNPDIGHYPGGEYSFWRCIIIRGDNWQLDTLPLEPALTTIPCGGSARDEPGRGDEDTECGRLVVPDIR